MSDLSTMRNIGKELSRKLLTVGITSAEMLNQAGAKQAFLKMKEVFPEICLVHLYALQGAIDNIDYNCLSEQVKGELKEFSDTFK